jgi:hypothetical protein
MSEHWNITYRVRTQLGNSSVYVEDNPSLFNSSSYFMPYAAFSRYPLNQAPASVVGFDIYSDPARSAAIQRARQYNQISFSAPTAPLQNPNGPNTVRDTRAKAAHRAV